MKPFGWAYLGCGGIARTTAEELTDSGAGRIVAAWNRTPEKAKAFVETFGGTAYAAPEEAVLAPEVEGVYIATTADMHAPLTRLCVDLGKPVLCEKPFAVNAAEAEAVFAHAEAKGVYVSEAMWTWHGRVALTVRDWLQQKRIGMIVRVTSCFSRNLAPTHPRLIDPARIGGALLDLGIYNLRYGYGLFGMPEQITCDGFLQGGVDMHETVRMRYPGFTAECVIGIDEDRDETFEIIGTAGVVRIPNFHMADFAVLDAEIPERVDDPSPHYAVQFAQTGEEIRAGRRAGQFITAQSTVDVLRLMDTCRAQMGLRYPGEKQG